MRHTSLPCFPRSISPDANATRALGEGLGVALNLAPNLHPGGKAGDLAWRYPPPRPAPTSGAGALGCGLRLAGWRSSFGVAAQCRPRHCQSRAPVLKAGKGAGRGRSDDIEAQARSNSSFRCAPHERSFACFGPVDQRLARSDRRAGPRSIRIRSPVFPTRQRRRSGRRRQR